MIAELAVEALFASALQPSDRPSREAVNAAITASVLRLGSAGCTDVVAREFGDHPEVAVRRMQWCLAAVHATESPAHT